MKPYFVPLNKEYFFKIKNGEQDCEIRPTDHRGWRIKNIYPGRNLQFSNGYGNYDRIIKKAVRVLTTNSLKQSGIPQWHIDAVEGIYGKRDNWLIAYV